MSKETKEVATVEAVTPTKTKYRIKGLKEAPTMPIRLGGKDYDLANLTDAQLDRLIELQCPYVEKVK